MSNLSFIDHDAPFSERLKDLSSSRTLCNLYFTLCFHHIIFHASIVSYLMFNNFNFVFLVIL